MVYDFLVIGSGCTGIQAARTLVDAGAKVGLIDVGEKDEKYAALIPDRDFLSVRRSDPEQHCYWLGDSFEGTLSGPIRGGTQLTPPRQFVTRNADRYAPFRSDEFSPVQSMARGGLGAAWGLGAHVFSDGELRKCGLDPSALEAAYETVSRRVGISAAPNDIAKFSLGRLQSYQQPLEIDENAKALLHAYERKKETLNRQGFFLGQCPLALLGEDLGARKKNRLHDMEFWSDHDRSGYRPWITLEELGKAERFVYLPGRLALSFKERSNQVDVLVRRVDTGATEELSCRKLVLGAGAFGTARIAIRSFAYRQTQLPLVCNPFSYLAALNLRMLGRAGSDRRHSLAQLVLFYDCNGSADDAIMVSIFSYRALLLFRLLKDFPFNFSDGKKLMQLLQSALVLATLNHPDSPSDGKHLLLVRDPDSITGDVFECRFRPGEDEERAMHAKNRRIVVAFRRMGCLTLKKIDLVPGASIHYGGTLPFSDSEKPFHTSPQGRLYGTRRVFVADGSAFRYLPAKGPTLTFMAHAHLVASHAGADRG
jgi:hypothetical protein